jgi:CDP-glycerol glycerophosphotransferase
MKLRHWMARVILPYSLWLARSLTPTRKLVVVHGFPETEGNAVEMVRALEGSYPGTIVWLDSPGPLYAESLGIGSSGRVKHLPRLSFRGILAYITAAATFFTHGLYGIPPRVPRKPTVNVWHGEAIKNFRPLFPDRRVGGSPADFHVASTRLLGPESALASGTPAPALLSTGYPRGVQLRKPCADADLESLGIDPSQKFVLWVPTFRQTSSVSATPTWSDTADPGQDIALADVMSSYAARLADCGITLVIKPHPLDRLSRATPGAISLSDSELKSNGVAFYSVLARAAGLITDFSSIANEYLLLDRPIAYFFPDKDAYVSRRGLIRPDALDNLAGPALETLEDVERFAADIHSSGSSTREQRQRAREWFGTLTDSNSADRILRAVADSSKSHFAASLTNQTGRASATPSATR